jgi:hypothetical protein
MTQLEPVDAAFVAKMTSVMRELLVTCELGDGKRFLAALTALGNAVIDRKVGRPQARDQALARALTRLR